MDMRKFYILLVSFLSGASVTAATAAGDTLRQEAAKKLKPMLHAVDISKYDITNPRKAAARPAAVTPAPASPMLKTPRMKAQKQLRTLDKVECTYSTTGEKYSLQEFKFDGHGWPVMRINSLYDAGTKEYAPVENYMYEWDEDGYCTSQWQTSQLYGLGIRYDYKYNDQKLATEQIYYENSGQGNTEWAAMQKNEYKYDGRGNIIEETVYVPSASAGQWTPYSKAKATWDENGWQTLYEPYLWDGAAWQGTGERFVYTWKAKDRMSRCQSSIWVNGQWLFYCDLQQDFDDNLNLTRREKRFYNQELDNWNGCCVWQGSYYENERMLSVYDENGHMTSSKAYGMTDATTGEWVLGAWETDKWTQTGDGGWKNEYAGHLGDESDYTDSYGGFVTYDSEGRETHKLDRMYDYTQQKLLNDMEIITTYNGNGDVLTEKSYTFDKDEANTRKGDLWVENTYDEHYNITGTINRSAGSIGIPFGSPALADGAEGGDGVEDDGIDWQYSSKFEYYYEQDTVRVKKLGWRWQGGDWVKYIDEEAVYDYDTPIEDVIAWPGYDTYHTIAQQKSLVVGSTDNFYIYDYTYSDFSTGITGTETGGRLRVWPTLVDGGFNVEAPEGSTVSIYSASGTCVAKAAPGRVSMAGMPGGIYIVTAGGESVKILKK